MSNRYQEKSEPRIIRLIKPQPQNKFKVPVGLRLMLGLAVLIAIGTLLFYFVPGLTRRPLTLMEALFTATSAATVTGLSILTTSTEFTLGGQIVLLFLIQMGGVGYMVGAILILQILGRQIKLHNRVALASSLGLNQTTNVLLILRKSLIFMLLVEGIGALLLFLYWRTSGIVPAEKALFYAVFHSISAFCNAGFDLFAGLPAYPGGIPGDTPTLLILGFLIIIGGLGIPVISDTIFWRGGKKLSLNTRITLGVAAFLIIFGWIGLFLAETKADGLLNESILQERVVHTWFQSVSSRTAGFPGFRNFDKMQGASRLLVMALMFIGCAPASMGGGITTGTFAVLSIALFSYVRGHPQAVISKRTIAIGTVQRATAVLTLSIGAVFLASWLILLTNKLSFSFVLFEVVSALATCGLSLGITDNLNPFGLTIIMIMMFWGRLGALTIAIAFLQRQKPSQLLKYPEASVLIG